MNRFATIKIRETGESKRVKIGSDIKPEIQKSVIDKWQSLIDTVARLINVPAGLIMRLNKDAIEVFLSSKTNGNPYEKGEEAQLIYGLYCETVIGTQQKLLIPDATKSDAWKQNNPDIDLNMISYLGFPVNWPDGEIFGTVCLLDNKENKYHPDVEDLLRQAKQHLENDLEILFLNNALKQKNLQLQQSNNTKSKFLSLISHDIRGSVSTINEFIKMIVNDFDSYDRAQLKFILNSLGHHASASYETLENLLSWSKSDILQIEPALKSIDIVEVFEKVLFYFDQPIQMKKLRITKSYHSQKVFVNADENMITVIVRNIISNAIKYNNEKGEIKIKVAPVGDKYELVIEDTGIGMSQNAIDKLFKYNDKYENGTSGESSAGIGLILIKEFLDKMDAQISVKSEVGQGSTFKIEIQGDQ
jgi:signal transduction histidine kinase